MNRRVATKISRRLLMDSFARVRAGKPLLPAKWITYRSSTLVESTRIVCRDLLRGSRRLGLLPHTRPAAPPPAGGSSEPGGDR